MQSCGPVALPCCCPAWLLPLPGVYFESPDHIIDVAARAPSCSSHTSQLLCNKGSSNPISLRPLVCRKERSQVPVRGRQIRRCGAESRRWTDHLHAPPCPWSLDDGAKWQRSAKGEGGSLTVTHSLSPRPACPDHPLFPPSLPLPTLAGEQLSRARTHQPTSRQLYSRHPRPSAPEVALLLLQRKRSI